MAITIVNTGKRGKEDIFFDDAGNGSTVEVERSNNQRVTLHKINASHIPITTTVRNKKDASGNVVGSGNNDLDVDAVLEQIQSDLYNLGQPDGSTLEVTGSDGSRALGVKAEGITEDKLKQTGGSEAVTNATMRANAVAGSASGASGQNVVEAGSIGNADIGDDEINSEHYAAASIDHEHLADNIVDKDNLSMDGSGDTFTQYIVGGVRHTITAGEAGNPSVTVSGFSNLAATDMFLCSLNVNQATVKVLHSVERATASSVTVTVSANFLENDVVSILAFRDTTAIS